MKIKICGIRTLSDVDIINEAMPDFCGFILSVTKPFKRAISIDTAKMLRNKINSDIKCVGVFVDDEISHILSFVKSNVIDYIQLHGSENGEYIKELRKFTNIPIIKMVKAGKCSDFSYFESLDCDFLLLDSGEGSGKTFDWSAKPDTVNKSYFLAGGLNCDNISRALEIFTPYCVDISSGVENSSGFKDREKVLKIMEIVKNVKQ